MACSARFPEMTRGKEYDKLEKAIVVFLTGDDGGTTW